MNRILFITIFILFTVVGTHANTFKEHLSVNVTGSEKINWTAGFLTSEAKVRIPEIIQNPTHPRYMNDGTSVSLTRARSDARLEAGERARLRLMQALLDMPVNGDYYVRDLLEENSAFRTAMGDLPEYIKIKTRRTAEDSVSMIISLPFRGENGIYRTLSSAGSVSGKRQAVPIADDPQSSGKEDKISGIIIDATHLNDFNPSLLPRIFNDQGRLIYSQEMLSRGALINRGTAVYYTEYESALRDGRAGSEPYYLYAAGSSGKTNGDLFLDNEETVRILSSESGRHALSQGSVIILVKKQNAGSEKHGNRKNN
jgi:hypothetical protein